MAELKAVIIAGNAVEARIYLRELGYHPSEVYAVSTARSLEGLPLPPSVAIHRVGTYARRPDIEAIETVIKYNRRKCARG